MKQAGSIDQKVEETDTGLFEAKTEENQKPVVAFEETGCVEGSWEKDDHENMIPSENTNVKKGVTFRKIWFTGVDIRRDTKICHGYAYDNISNISRNIIKI